jgi:hypothetical protein
MAVYTLTIIVIIITVAWCCCGSPSCLAAYQCHASNSHDVLISVSIYSEQEDYEVVRKIGRGKYSEVFEGLNVVTPTPTPVRPSAI